MTATGQPPADERDGVAATPRRRIVGMSSMGCLTLIRLVE